MNKEAFTEYSPQILFQHAFKVSYQAHQSHLSYRFNVPANCAILKIYFEYDPLWEKNPKTMRRALDLAGLYQDKVEENAGFRNLITVSLNDPENFRGAHHYFNTQQEMILSASEASLGFIAGEIQAGQWELILSCHGIFSDEIQATLKIEAWLSKPAEPFLCPFAQARPDLKVKDRPFIGSQDLVDYRLELHAHTTHSDAQQSTQELLQAADQLSLDWLAITDHNTISALQEAKHLPQDSYRVKLLVGMELTTFYGHFLIYGPQAKVCRDWTRVTWDNFNHYLQTLVEEGLMVTIAHPFDVGNPYCTGCRFDYPLADYRYVDNIEVWNEANPVGRAKNEQAYQHWLQLLKAGLEINATAGRDWHRSNPTDQVAITHVMAPKEAQAAQILQALSLGRSYISLQPELSFTVNQHYQLGDRVPQIFDQWQVDIALSDLPKQAQRIELWSEDQCLLTESIAGSNGYHGQFTLPMADHRLLRLEVLDSANQLLLFTNPIYR